MIVGILGGSGLYDLEGLSDVREHAVATPFGAPSAPLIVGKVGIGKTTRSSWCSFRDTGAGTGSCRRRSTTARTCTRSSSWAPTKVISVSAVGSLREGLVPGDLVVVDQFIDKTYRRESTFFGDGIVGHVGYADPVCGALAGALHAQALAHGFEAGRRRGALANRRARTDAARAQRRHLRVHGGAAVLDARRVAAAPELGRRRDRHDRGDRGQALPRGRALLRVAGAGDRLRLLAPRRGGGQRVVDRRGAAGQRARAKEIVRAVLPRLASLPACGCGSAAAHAIMTSPEAIPAAARERLKVLYGRYL